MKTVLIVDVETTGLDPEKDSIIELGWARWSIEHHALIDCGSWLQHVDDNPAEVINGIPAVLARTNGKAGPSDHLIPFEFDAVVAHNAVFDREFFEKYHWQFPVSNWICTLEDMAWPKGDGNARSLTALALAHGCAVVAAHRAINDCLLMARLFEAVPDIAERLEAGLAHALLPKAWLVAKVPFERKDEAKERGFHWDPERKEWRRYMTIEDATAFPFTCRVEQEARR